MNEIKYLADEIKNRLSSIESAHYSHFVGRQYDEYYQEDHPGWTEDWLKKSIPELYIFICAYLEAKQMTFLLDNFQEKFKKRISQEKELLSSGLLHPEGDEELLILNEFRSFLKPFKDFDYRQLNEDRTIKLTSILEQTDYIVKNCNIEIQREADIYKQVKWVLGLYFPTCRLRGKASFIQQFKTYEPDILIPELKTALEYKYISKPSDNIDDFIDQVRIDASNYVGDYRFENFIAVLYLEDSSLATPQHIVESWNAKRFPANWKLVVVIGSPTQKKIM